jgi:hypothetical protein
MQFEVVLSPTKFEPQITQIAQIFLEIRIHHFRLGELD